MEVWNGKNYLIIKITLGYIQLTLFCCLENELLTCFEKRGKGQLKEEQKQENHRWRNLEQTQTVCHHPCKWTETTEKTTPCHRSQSQHRDLLEGQRGYQPSHACAAQPAVAEELCTVFQLLPLWCEQKEGSREPSSHFFSLSGEHLVRENWLPVLCDYASPMCWRSIFSAKITGWYYQIPALSSINNLFKGASTTTCTL